MSAIYSYEHVEDGIQREQWYGVSNLAQFKRVRTLPAFSVHAYWGAYYPEPMFMRAWRIRKGRCKTFKLPRTSWDPGDEFNDDWISDMLDYGGQHMLRENPWDVTMTDTEKTFCRLGADIAQCSHKDARGVKPMLSPQVGLVAMLVLSYYREMGAPQLHDYTMAGKVPYSDAYKAAKNSTRLMEDALGGNPFEEIVGEMIMTLDPHQTEIACHFDSDSDISPLDNLQIDPPSYEDITRTGFQTPSIDSNSPDSSIDIPWPVGDLDEDYPESNLE